MATITNDAPVAATQLADKLTAHELDVLRVLVRGFSNAEIARVLCVSEGTVRNHISAILAKLNLTDRTQAAILAVKHGFG
ncbi:MAG: response regulator transcription factor [Chloroflexota bacterium]